MWDTIRRAPGASRAEVLAAAGALLVVVTLLSLGLMSSREKSRARACLANLGRYGIAMASYAEDFGGVLPYENTGDESLGHIVWDEALESYLGSRNRLCPSVDRGAKNYRAGYRINSKLGRRNATPPKPYRLLSELAEPSATVMLFDAAYGKRKLSLKGGLADVDFRHDGCANLLFADWQVQAFTSPELTEASDWLPPTVIWDPDDASLASPAAAGGS